MDGRSALIRDLLPRCTPLDREVILSVAEASLPREEVAPGRGRRYADASIDRLLACNVLKVQGGRIAINPTTTEWTGRYAMTRPREFTLIPSGDWVSTRIAQSTSIDVHRPTGFAPMDRSVIQYVRTPWGDDQGEAFMRNAPVRPATKESSAQGDVVPDQAELMRATAFLDKHFMNQAYGWSSEMARASRQYPSDWFLKAFKVGKQAEASGRKVGGFGFFVAMLRDWKLTGLPAVGPWDTLDDDMKAVRPPEPPPPTPEQEEEIKRKRLQERLAMARANGSPLAVARRTGARLDDVLRRGEARDFLTGEPVTFENALAVECGDEFRFKYQNGRPGYVLPALVPSLDPLDPNYPGELVRPIPPELLACFRDRPREWICEYMDREAAKKAAEEEETKQKMRAWHKKQKEAKAERIALGLPPTTSHEFMERWAAARR